MTTASKTVPCGFESCLAQEKENMKRKQNRFEIVRDKETKKDRESPLIIGDEKVYTKDQIRRMLYSNNPIGNWTPLDVYDFVIFKN